MREAGTRAERGQAALAAPGGFSRLLRFVGVSVAVHGLLAMAVLRQGPASVPLARTVPVSSPAEMVWFEGTATHAPVAAPPALPEVPRSAVRPAPRVASAARPKVEPLPLPAEKAPVQETPTPEARPLLPAPGSSSGGEPVGSAATAGSQGGASVSSGGGVGVASSGPGVAGSAAPAVDLMAYARRLSSVVASQRRYPASAARLGMEGKARVQVRVNRDGSLASPPRLVASSGYDVLDAEALRMVEAAAPFASLPEGHPRPAAEFVIPVDFSLRPAG